jgi:hypothetical protein
MAEVGLKIGVACRTIYLYPPFLAVLLRPLASLSFDTARTIWFFASFSCWLTFLFISFKVARLSKIPKKVLFFALIFALLLPSVYIALLLGQVSLFVLLLLSSSIYLLPYSDLRSQSLVGIFLGLAISIHLTTAILLFAILLHRRFITFSTTLLTLFVTFVIGILGSGGWLNTYAWFSEGLNNAMLISKQSYGNLALQATIERFFTPQQFEVEVTVTFLNQTPSFNIQLRPLIESPLLGKLLSSSCSLLIGLVTLYCLLRGKQIQTKDSLQFDSAFLLTTVTLLSPLVWVYYYTWLLIPFFLLGQKNYQIHPIRLLLLLSYFFIVLERLKNPLIILTKSPFALSIGCFGSLILWGTFVYLALKPQKEDFCVFGSTEISNK